MVSSFEHELSSDGVEILSEPLSIFTVHSRCRWCMRVPSTSGQGLGLSHPQVTTSEVSRPAPITPFVSPTRPLVDLTREIAPNPPVRLVVTVEAQTVRSVGQKSTSKGRSHPPPRSRWILSSFYVAQTEQYYVDLQTMKEAQATELKNVEAQATTTSEKLLVMSHWQECIHREAIEKVLEGEKDVLAQQKADHVVELEEIVSLASEADYPDKSFS
ncbi:unnamed protein product [Lupinus luteus]|uniref:Uncharacterized protein n=1 Tax=Lupinus luteus TaxID=3873 RepID=A0AAV1WH40_LUPLU